MSTEGVGTSICQRLRQAARRITQMYDHALAPVGLRVTQLPILATLDEEGPMAMNALAARPYDLDVATQVPHAAVRVFVMGQRGVEREPATEADSAAMAAIASR